MKKLRAESLDSLRGFAIFMMVLSGSHLSWVLPAWMSHAQCPPPSGAFDPSIYGITWVDLVFPFFLFSMGAAYAFSIGSRIERGVGKGRLIIDALWRYAKLAYFALFIYHVNPWVLSNAPGRDGVATVTDWIITLCGFVLLFAIYLRIPGQLNIWVRRTIHWLGVVVATALMVWTDCRNGGSFNLYQSNIIILVLANMAAFGTIIYILTINRPWARVAVLPFLMAIILCKNADGSWQQDVFNWSPLPWLYRFDFLKYLFIIIPGTFDGEYLHSSLKTRTTRQSEGTATTPKYNWATILVALLSATLIGLNVWMLFERYLVANLFTSAAIVVAIAILSRFMPLYSKFYIRLTSLGAYMLMLGLFFEAFDGGIRKDPSSFDYWFTTSGLACYCLNFFVIICDIFHWRRIAAPFSMAGKNPMIAYVAAQLFVMPVLNLCHIGDAYTLDYFTVSPFMAVLHGLIVTSLAIATAAFFTHIKWFWRT